MACQTGRRTARRDNGRWPRWGSPTCPACARRPLGSRLPAIHHGNRCAQMTVFIAVRERVPMVPGRPSSSGSATQRRRSRRNGRHEYGHSDHLGGGLGNGSTGSVLRRCLTTDPPRTWIGALRAAVSIGGCEGVRWGRDRPSACQPSTFHVKSAASQFRRTSPSPREGVGGPARRPATECSVGGCWPHVAGAVAIVLACRRLRTTTVDITDGLQDVDGDTMALSIVVSADGARTFGVPARSLAAQAGPSVHAGLGEHTANTPLWVGGGDLPPQARHDTRSAPRPGSVRLGRSPHAAIRPARGGGCRR